MIEVQVPELAESISEANLQQWQKKVGDLVTQGEIIVTVETDKVVLEVYAPESGKLTEILLPDGADVVSKQLIAKIDPSADVNVNASAAQDISGSGSGSGSAKSVAAKSGANSASSTTAKQSGSKDVAVKVPELAESISEANLQQWQKKVGDAVAQGDILVTVETDKVVLEVYAPSSGTLSEIILPDNSEVQSNQLIAKIAAGAVLANTATATDTDIATKSTSATATTASSGLLGKLSSTIDKISAGVVGLAKENPANPANSANQMAGQASVKPEKNAGTRILPAARKLAEEKNVNLRQVRGTGVDGQITKDDVMLHLSTATASSSSVNQASSEREIERVPMSKLRQRVAVRLLQSQQTTATLTTFNEADMSEVILLRNMYKQAFEERHGVKLGFMSFFVKAVAHALTKYPVIGAMIDGKDIVYHKYSDIGVAVSSPRGLVVPVLRNAELMTMAQIEKQIAIFAQKAKDATLSLDDLSGGNFSITNGGVFGSMLSTPIINPPQSAILGVHATKQRAVVVNEQVVARPMNYLALSYDHRLIDGRDAVLFLRSVVDSLEQPARLMLDL